MNVISTIINFAIWLVLFQKCRSACCVHVFNNVTGSCFYKTNATEDWLTARTICESIGAKLALPVHQSDQDLATSLDFSGWLDLNDIEQEGKFVDYEGKEPEVDFWDGTEPNNAGSGEDCGSLRRSSSRWNDLPCDRKHLFICEWPNIPVVQSHGMSALSFRKLRVTSVCNVFKMAAVAMTSAIGCASSCSKLDLCVLISFETNVNLSESESSVPQPRCVLYKYHEGNREFFLSKSTNIFLVE